MLSNVGHTIQKIINNTPINISVNQTSTTVVTNGGNVFQSGLISNRIQDTFKEIVANENIIGRVIDSQSTDNKVYLLNAAGAVIEYDYNIGSCSPVVREVYSPVICANDKAIKIATGSGHVVILTENHKVYGVGDNGQYQLIPQGQCKYDCAAEMLVLTTNTHDNCCCDKFMGTITPPENCAQKCSAVKCIKGTGSFEDFLVIEGVTFTAAGTTTPQTGNLLVPVTVGYVYTGFLCVSCAQASGNITFCFTLTIPKTCCATFQLVGADGSLIANINVEICTPIIITPPAPFTACISGTCGSIVNVGIDSPVTGLSATVGTNGVINLIQNSSSIGTITPVGGLFSASGTGTLTVTLEISQGIDVLIDCGCDFGKCDIKQPCWTDVFAGFDTSVLVDNCNRMYVFGSIHEIRSNKNLLKRSCLEELLNKTHANVSFPATQLNCCVKPRNDNCKCVECRDRCFKTDLSKFGVSLSFGQDDDCCKQNTNVCDFLKALQNCNEAPLCDNTCAPCDGNIYLDVQAHCDCQCGAAQKVKIGTINLLNKQSVCNLVSSNAGQIIVNITSNSLIEFDLNQYCIDGKFYPLYQPIKLNITDVSAQSSNATLYVDVCKSGGIYFNCGGDCSSRNDRCNVEFTAFPDSTDPVTGNKYILNFGGIMDPAELSNLKQAAGLNPYYPCPQFSSTCNPILIDTYLRGGDCVSFIAPGSPVRQAITADLPTVFRLNRRVLDIGVGANNLSVLVGGLACPNEIFVIGQNCYGELGINSNETVVCWNQINRCLFDCQVNAIFSGKNVTMYITQSHRVYASGQWKCLVNSNVPVCIPSIAQAWKIKEIGISENQIVYIGHDGCVFGQGDNSLGELGLCHINCVPRAIPLSFFYRWNQWNAKQLCDEFRHPVEKNYKKAYVREEECGSPEVKRYRNAKYYGKKYVANDRCCNPNSNRYYRYN
jgi:hypothetical protein